MAGVQASCSEGVAGSVSRAVHDLAELQLRWGLAYQKSSPDWGKMADRVVHEIRVEIESRWPVVFGEELKLEGLSCSFVGHSLSRFGRLDNSYIPVVKIHKF